MPAVLVWMGKAAAASAAPCGTEKLRRGNSTSRCCDDVRALPAAVESARYQTQDQCPSLASARAVGGGTPLGLGGFHPPLDDSEGAWTHFKPSPPIPHTLHQSIRSSLSELDYRDCRSAGASLGGTAMATTATMVSDVCALIHTLLLALLCPCAHPLTCSLTSYLPSPRSVDARGVRPHGWVERPWR